MDPSSIPRLGPTITLERPASSPSDWARALTHGRLDEVTAIFNRTPSMLRDELLAQGFCLISKDDQISKAEFLLSRVAESRTGITGFQPCDDQGRTPLMLALNANSSRLIAFLINHGIANVKAHDHEGKTALMYPQTMNSVRLIRPLGRGSQDDIVNARDKRGQSVLMWTLQENPDQQVARYLIDEGADINAQDDEGRTILMTAVWKNQMDILDELARKVDVGKFDRRQRNALHHLAIDRDRVEQNRHDCDETILNILLREKIDPNDQDWLGRNALSCALASGNCELARVLIQRRICDIHAITTSGWNMLHIACDRENNSVDLIADLIKKGLDINKATRRSRKTPVHIAARSGNIPILEFLLRLPNVKRAERDAYGHTPLLCAAPHDDDLRAKIGRMLAPWNKWTLESLRADARYSSIKAAADAWSATVVDFDEDKPEEPVLKEHKIYNLIHEPRETNPEEPLFSTKPDKTFRWIHLPANNITWCRDLMIKNYIEKQCRDVQGFRDLERSLNHQHRGHEYHLHSRYMTPVCQAVLRPSKKRSTPLNLHITRSSTGLEAKDSDDHPGDLLRPFREGSQPSGSSNGSWWLERRNSSQAIYRPRMLSPELQEAEPLQTVDVQRRQQVEKTSAIEDAAVGHVFMFMPYLHYEKFDDMIRMEKELDKMIDPARRPKKRATSKKYDNIKDKPNDLGTKLFQGHLHKSNLSLHIRRTLDQFFYHNIDTKIRDRSQVIHRYQIKTNAEDHKILMVDQFWMWIIDDDLVITSFPHSWEDPKSDQSDMLENIKETVIAGNKDPIANVHQLAVMIASRFYGTHDGHGFSSDEPRALEMFSAEIGDAMDREVKLFKRFARYASKADYAKKHSLFETDAFRKFNKALLNIKAETKLLALVKDIRDELSMLKVLFEYQKHVMPNFRDAIESISKQQDRYKLAKKRIAKSFDEQARNIDRPLETVKSMDKQSERIYESIRDLLDLKQKHVNAVEARYTREQATSTSRQGKTLMVFTIVTVIFLPLSFIAAFFAIPIGAYKRFSDENGMSLSFVSKWTFGIGIPLAVVCVFAALLVGPFAVTLHEHVVGSNAYRYCTNSKPWRKFRESSFYIWWMQESPEASFQKAEAEEDYSFSEGDDSEDELMAQKQREQEHFKRSLQLHRPEHFA